MSVSYTILYDRSGIVEVSKCSVLPLSFIWLLLTSYNLIWPQYSIQGLERMYKLTPFFWIISPVLSNVNKKTNVTQKIVSYYSDLLPSRQTAATVCSSPILLPPSCPFTISLSFKHRYHVDVLARVSTTNISRVWRLISRSGSCK
jgi:hypothetical protein